MGFALFIQYNFINVHIPQHLVLSVLSDPVGTETDALTDGQIQSFIFCIAYVNHNYFSSH